MPITGHLRKARNSWKREIVTVHSSLINPGKTREAESQDTTDLVGKRDSGLVDNTWLNEGYEGKVIDQKAAEESGSIPNAWSGTVRFATLTDSRATYPLESAAWI